jgi:hypothetical protein
MASLLYNAGADSRGGAPGARPPPLKLEKNIIFWRKIVIFHTKYPKMFAPPSPIGKNMIFWRKIVIFHKSRFYAKKSYFFQLAREARTFWGISCEKSRFYAKK